MFRLDFQNAGITSFFKMLDFLGRNKRCLGGKRPDSGAYVVWRIIYVCVGFFCLMAALMGAFALYGVIQTHIGNNPVEPPPGVDSLGEFAREMAPPGHFEKIDVDGALFFVWYGQLESSLASGPATYIFNASGELVRKRPIDC